MILVKATGAKVVLVTRVKVSPMFKRNALISMLFVLCVGAASYIYIGQVEKQSVVEAELLKAQAEKASATLSYQLKKWRQSLALSASDPALKATLVKGGDVLASWVGKRSSSISGLLKLRVVRPGLMQIDISSTPPLRYAGLDLIRRVEISQKSQLAEVHMMAGDERHIAIAVPVMDKDELLAIVLGAFDVNVMQKVLALVLMEEKDGFFSLQQGGLRIAASGGEAHETGISFGRVKVLGSQWGIDFKRKVLAVPLTQDNVLTYTLAVLIAILFFGLAAGGWNNEKTRKKLTETIRKKMARKPKVKEVVSVDEVAGNEEFDQVAGSTDDARITAMKASIEDKIASNGPETIKRESMVDVEEDAHLLQSIFRAYDIRGIVDETLTEYGVLLIGQSIATEALNAGQESIVIARDGRLHSKRLSDALARGIQLTGCDVVDIGQVPTPVLYFATHELDTQSGVMITGSHNPKEYNGLKIVIAGETLSGDAIQGLYKRIETASFSSGKGSYQEKMILPEYVGAIREDVRLGRLMKVVVDCGNGVAGEAAPMLLSTLGCDVVPLYCDIDGEFPNHHPDPSKPENLQDLINKVRDEGAELGLAFDGDGDRLGVVDSNGNVIWPDRQMMLYAIDVLSRQAGADILYDVKCTRNLAKVIVKHGGKPVMSKTGHSLIKAKMKETNAELAGEMSGHIFFKERWYGFDDALYTAARLLEILTAEFRETAEIFAELPDSVNTPELTVNLQEGENFTFVEKLQEIANFGDAKIITIDGIRVEYQDGWGLVRASNTTPSLVLRFEAEDEQALARIKAVFKEQVRLVNKDIDLPF